MSKDIKDISSASTLSTGAKVYVHQNDDFVQVPAEQIVLAEKTARAAADTTLDGKITAANAQITAIKQKALEDSLRIDALTTTVNGKQNKLTAGNGITIASNGTISVSYANGDEVSY